MLPWGTPTEIDRLRRRETISNNMADLNDLFFYGDDFDAILGTLEDEEELDEHFKQAADEVSVIIFCSDSKYYKKL